MQISEIDLSEHQTLFETIEFNYPATKQDRLDIKRIIMDEENPLYLRAMTLSALTLNLLRYFDEEKFESLYTYTLEDQHKTIRMRAWVAVVLVAMKHNVRLSFDEKLMDQLKFMIEECEASENKNYMLAIQSALYKCTQARIAAKQMKDTLGPQIEKGLQVIKEQKNMNEEDIAPEWDNYLEKSGIQEQINDLIDLQREGVDIMFSTFVQMARFPFFSKKCNWFMPFSEEHPLVSAIAKKGTTAELMVKIMSKSGNMCSGDKYGNVLMLSLVPGSQFDQIETALKANDVKVENIVEANEKDEMLAYMHDLYRYYHISNFAKDEYNPFDRSLYFGNYYGLNYVLYNIELKKKLAQFLYKNKIYKDAAFALKDLVEKEETEEFLQKYAYCLQNDNTTDRTELIEVLSKANKLYPGNKWTIKNLSRQLALANAPIKQCEEVLRDGCAAFPEDTDMINRLAACLIKQGIYDEALQLLFKSDVIKEDVVATMEMIVECATKLGRNDVVARYSKRIDELLK